MHQLIQKFERKHMTWLVNSLVFLFFVTVLAFPKGYSYAPMALAVIGVIYLFVHLFVFKKKLNPTKEDKWLIFAFVFYFSTFALSAVIHGDGWREIDNPSRVLLFLPLLLLFREFPINIKIILYGIPIGAAVSGVIAIYQKFYLGLDKPFPNIMSIQAGNIAMSLGLLAITITLYFGMKKWYLTVLCSLLSATFGVAASALSGARGGWIALPFIFILILFSYRRLISKKTMAIMVLIFTVLTGAITVTPGFNVIARYQDAKNNIVQYINHDYKHTSLGSRLDMWQNAITGIQEKPILGWGSRGYIELKKQQVEENKMYKGTLRFNDAHNQFLDSFVKKGIIGLTGVLLILYIPLKIFSAKLPVKNVEIKCIATIGIVHIMSTIFYSLSQTFLGHNSGSIFYIFFTLLFYSILMKRSLSLDQNP